MSSSLCESLSAPPPLNKLNVKHEEVNNNSIYCGAHNPPVNLNARGRWRLLAQAIRKSESCPISCSSPENDNGLIATVSVRRFATFDLIDKEQLDYDEQLSTLLGNRDDWFTYILTANAQRYSVNVHHVSRRFTTDDLIGFNNTGNICVWPSEEVLAHYVLGDLKQFRAKRVLELGGGMTCLAGLLIAKYAEPFAVHLTDGNPISVANVQRTVRLNELRCFVKCSELMWTVNPAVTTVDNDSLQINQKFDFILSADCLFFDETRSALVDTIWHQLNDSGVALIMAPKRGATLENFIQHSIARGFVCRVYHRYCDSIWQMHLQLKLSSPMYDENIHYPILLRLTKAKCQNGDTKDDVKQNV